MLESVLLFTLGFLTATLVVLIIAPTLWQRAVYLTQQRIAHALPFSISEIQADKDMLRANHAMQVRSLEMKSAELQEQTNQHFIEANQYRNQVDALKADHKQANEEIADLTFKLGEIKRLQKTGQLAESDFEEMDLSTNGVQEKLNAQTQRADALEAELAQLRVNFANLEIQNQDQSLALQQLQGKTPHSPAPAAPSATPSFDASSPLSAENISDHLAETREHILQLAAKVTAMSASEPHTHSPIHKLLSKETAFNTSKEKAHEKPSLAQRIISAQTKTS